MYIHIVHIGTCHEIIMCFSVNPQAVVFGL